MNASNRYRMNVVLLLALSAALRASAALGVYHDYDTLTARLNACAAAYPEICRLHSLGQSARGRELWALLITDHPDDEEDEPEFRYGASIHGNEPEGREMCLYFIDMLLTEYGTLDRITNLVDRTAIWILPSMNPDSDDRHNANGIDLDRAFPTLTDGSLSRFDGGPLTALIREPEVQHLMKWMAQNSFVLSADLHSGEELVIYPYCHDYVATPDERLFQDLSRRYSARNPSMWNNTDFPDGIVSGADWFIALGTLQDWAYIHLGCYALTIELHKSQQVLPADELPALWSDNAESMLALLEAAHIGIRGLVTDRSSAEPLWAQVFVEGNSQPVFTDPDVGDYHRILLPGTYNLIVYAHGYVPRRLKDIVVAEGPATRLDVELLPDRASPDFDDNGIVDANDLDLLMAAWGQNRPALDIAPLPAGDGTIDERDLELFAEFWRCDIPDVPRSPLVSRWALDEADGNKAHDDTGSKDGLLLGDPFWQPDAGMLDGALAFDGYDDHILVDDAVIDPADGPFSVLAWIQGGAPGQVILSQADGASWLRTDALAGFLATELEGRDRFDGPLDSDAPVTDGDWHRIALVYDGTARRLYVDGLLVAEDLQPGGLAPNSGGLYIGCAADQTPGSFFSGLLDDLRVYNHPVAP